MSLGLLAPAALAAAGLLVLPLIAHLTRQNPRERVAYGAMMLLERLQRRLRRRRRVKDPWLLLVRLLALLVAIGAIAGAELRYEGGVPDFGGTGRVVIVFDRSPSMLLADHGATLFERARRDADGFVRGLPGGTLVGVVAYDRQAERLTPVLTSERDAAAAAIASLSPGPAGSELRLGLLEARRMLGGEPGEVVVFTDEAGPRQVLDAQPEIEAIVETGSAVLPRAVHADPPRNVAVLDAVYGRGPEGGTVKVRLANHGPAAVEVPCEVTLPDGAKIPVFVDVPAAGVDAGGTPVPGEAEEDVTVPPVAAGGVGEARCEDPDLPGDDVRYFHLPTVGASRVLVIDGDPGDTPTRSEVFFVERALAPWGALQSAVRPDIATPAGLTDLDPNEHRVVMLANVADPRPYGPMLTEFVRQGGHLVIGVGDNVTADRYTAALGSILPAPFETVRDLAAPEELGVPLAVPDIDLPVFTPFSRGGRLDFTKVRAHRVFALAPYRDGPDVHTLLRWENGTPALVDRVVGQSHVLVWTSTLDLGWTNFPLQAVYMPLLHRIVGWLGGEASGGTAGRFDGIVGDPVKVPLPEIGVTPEVFGPDGAIVSSTVEGGAVRFVPKVPGAWRVGFEGAPPLAWVAVNPSPEESDVLRYASIAAVEAKVRPELFEIEVDLTPWLALAGLALLVAQAAAALRGPKPDEEAA